LQRRQPEKLLEIAEKSAIDVHRTLVTARQENNCCDQWCSAQKKISPNLCPTTTCHETMMTEYSVYDQEIHYCQSLYYAQQT